MSDMSDRFPVTFWLLIYQKRNKSWFTLARRLLM